MSKQRIGAGTRRPKSVDHSKRTLLKGMAGFSAGLVCAPAIIHAQAARQVRIVQQNGLLYVPCDMLAAGGMLQKQADKMGLGKIEVTSVTINSAAAVNDALLSGTADCGTAGPPPLLTIWDKTKGTPLEVRAMGAICNVPVTLYTINPNVKTLADFTSADKIAVPAVKVSFNAMMLEMEAEKLWNDPERLNPFTISMGHPDAVTAMSAGWGKASVTAHVAAPPFTQRGLKLPGAHAVTDSYKAMGGPVAISSLTASQRFKTEKPDLFQCTAKALEETINLLNSDKRTWIAFYKDLHKASESIDELMEIVNDPSFQYTNTPLRFTDVAAFMQRRGRLKNKPASWKDLFWETAHHQQGS